MRFRGCHPQSEYIPRAGKLHQSLCVDPWTLTINGARKEDEGGSPISIFAAHFPMVSTTSISHFWVKPGIWCYASQSLYPSFLLVESWPLSVKPFEITLIYLDDASRAKIFRIPDISRANTALRKSPTAEHYYLCNSVQIHPNRALLKLGWVQW